MRNLFTRVILAAITGLAGSVPSNATVLLNLIDPSTGTTTYDLSFTATGHEMTLDVGGYQVISFENVHYNNVSTSGGPNLLGGSWSFTPAASGSLAYPYDDGTSVPGLIFGGLSVGYYDTFSQTFATTPGETYRYSFAFTQGYEGPSELVVTATAAAATPTIPEPSTWAMMLLGFAGLAFVGYRGTRRGAPIAG